MAHPDIAADWTQVLPNHDDTTGYHETSGTSFATPRTAGILSLIITMLEKIQAICDRVLLMNWEEMACLSIAPIYRLRIQTSGMRSIFQVGIQVSRRGTRPQEQLRCLRLHLVPRWVGE